MIVECPECHTRYDASGRAPGKPVRCRCGAQFTIPKAPSEAAVLSCPVCGAQCDSAEDRCHYCKAVLAVLACPKCMGKVYVGSAFCQFCGTEIQLGARADLGAPAVRNCPRCREEPLSGHLVGDTLVDECGRCGGLWLERAGFDRLLKDRDALVAVTGLERPRTIDLDAVRAAGVASGPCSPSSVVYLRCPDCSQLMNRKNFAQRSGVILDICTPHGIWFDSDELGKVVTFVLRGGLDEARRREIEDLEREIRKKRDALRGLQMAGVAPLEMGGEIQRQSSLANLLVEKLFSIIFR